MKFTKSISFVMMLLALSCGNNKNVQAPPAVSNTPPPPSVDVTYVGTIEKDDQCGFVIQIKLEDKTFSVAPKNLDEPYHKPGMRVKFTTSDQLNPNVKCGTHFIIRLDYITALRG